MDFELAYDNQDLRFRQNKCTYLRKSGLSCYNISKRIK